MLVSYRRGSDDETSDRDKRKTETLELKRLGAQHISFLSLV
jgi:hypothetical protein